MEPASHSALPRSRTTTYSLRLPVERINQLKDVGAMLNVDPSALARDWIAEKLDSGSYQRRARRSPGEGVLAAYLDQLPATADGWTTTDRERWITGISGALNVFYPADKARTDA